MPPALGTELLVVMLLLIFLISPTALFFVLHEIFVAVGGIKGQMLSTGVLHGRLALEKRQEAAHRMRLQKGSWPRGSVKYR